MSAPGGQGATVAVVLTWRGRVGLFKDGAHAGPGLRLWRCLGGELPGGEDVLVSAARALLDATGLVVRDLEGFCPGPVVHVKDDTGHGRAVHTVLARTDRRRLRTDKARILYRWVRCDQLARFDGQVAWLQEVVDAALADGPTTPQAPADRDVRGRGTGRILRSWST